MRLERHRPSPGTAPRELTVKVLTFCVQSLKLKVPDTLSIELPLLVHSTHSDSKAPRTGRHRDSVHHMSYLSKLALAFSIWTAENGVTIA